VNTKLVSSVVATLFLTLGVVWSYPNQAFSQPGNQTANCDPSYTDVCIRPPPPDLNCPDVPNTDFKVLPPDPHGFDKDGNGMGCETELQH